MRIMNKDALERVRKSQLWKTLAETIQDKLFECDTGDKDMIITSNCNSVIVSYKDVSEILNAYGACQVAEYVFGNYEYLIDCNIPNDVPSTVAYEILITLADSTEWVMFHE